jgi:hypothetical protein
MCVWLLVPETSPTVCLSAMLEVSPKKKSDYRCHICKYSKINLELLLDRCIRKETDFM